MRSRWKSTEKNATASRPGCNKNTRIVVVCNILEKAEHSHEQLLKDKLNGLSHTLPESDSYADMKNVFQGAEFGLRNEIY